MRHYRLGRWKTLGAWLARKESLGRWLGLVAISFWGVHAAAHLGRGTPEQLLWVCHVAALGVGLGLLFGRRWLNAAGVLVLLVGTPVWAANLFIAGTFLPTSLLPHVGGLVLGLVGLKLLGPPEGDWWKALTLVALLLLVSRAVVSEAGNVNLVYGIWPKMADWWPLRGPTILAQVAAWAVVLWSVECLLRRKR